MSALAEALVAAQAELPCTLGKDADGEIVFAAREVGTRKYRYLTLDKLIAETRPTLTKHGLAILQAPSYAARGDEGAIPMLRTWLVHAESGGEYLFDTPLYLTDKTMQGLGAAITYARRYAWQSVLGIAAEEDTDAPAAEEVPF